MLGFLRQDPAANAYLLGQIARGAIGRDSIAGTFAGYWRRGQLEGLCCLGSNVVLSEPCADEAIAAFARMAQRAAAGIRVVVGPDDLTASFMECFERDGRNIALERGGQLLYGVDRDGLKVPGLLCEGLRQADVSELNQMLALDLAMVVEELGFDPFSHDLEGFRRGWLRRLREGRSWVVANEAGVIDFKVDQSAVSSDAIQLAGIFTRPSARRNGLAKRALASMCRQLLKEASVVTLYVHSDNTGARALYGGLGFTELGAVRSVWFDA